MRVLVVDDDKIIRAFLQGCLEMNGYEVLCAEDGFQAFNLWQGDREVFDLIITDLRMPGMTGQQLIEKIRRIKPVQPFLAMSGEANEDEIEWLSDQQIFFIRKPFYPQKVLLFVSRVLSSRPE